MHRERVWSSATERTARPVRGAHRASPHRTTFHDGIVVVCFLALVGVVVVGGLLMLLSWVTTMLPANTRIACPQQPACEASAPEEIQPALGDARAHELTPTSRQRWTLAEEVDGAWDATVRIRRVLSDARHHVEHVACRKETPGLAERVAVILGTAGVLALDEHHEDSCSVMSESGPGSLGFFGFGRPR